MIRVTILTTLIASCYQSLRCTRQFNGRRTNSFEPHLAYPCIAFKHECENGTCNDTNSAIFSYATTAEGMILFTANCNDKRLTPHYPRIHQILNTKSPFVKSKLPEAGRGTNSKVSSTILVTWTTPGLMTFRHSFRVSEIS